MELLYRLEENHRNISVNLEKLFVSHEYLLFSTKSHRADWYSDKVLHFYLGGSRFESSSEHLLF
jgi:hypothetical protein